jgi:predicted O-linked N-acetylglucosamine transferase (SPINDLY family)
MNPADERNHHGILLMKRGQPGEAIALFSEAIQLDPSFAAAHCNLGAALLAARRFNESLAAFGRATALQPSMVAAYMGQAAAFCGLGEIHTAIAVYRDIIARFPNPLDAFIQLGHMLLQTDRVDEAIDCYRHVLKQLPNRTDALGGLGSAMLRQGELDQAEKIFRDVVRIEPQSAIGWTNLGNALRLQLRVDEAQEAYERATVLAPNFAPPAANLGIVLLDQGLAESAVEMLRKAVALDPSSLAIHSNLVYACCFCPGVDARQQWDEAKAWAMRHESPRSDISDLKFEIPVAGFEIRKHPHPNPLPEYRERGPEEKHRLKVGYIGPDFREHVVGRNVLPVVEHHDRSAFEIHIFSTVLRPDSMTDRFRKSADHWHNCAGLGDGPIAEMIRDHGIDVLVDLTLHMQGNQLAVFARKPAPVAVTWAGYPGTTGLGAIDFRITDPYLDPPGQTEYYSEKSVRLPHSFWCYRPHPGCPEMNELPALSTGFITFGCLNNFAKVTGRALDLWSQVLRGVPNSRLLMLAPPGKVRQRTVDRFVAGGVAGDRIGFLDRGDVPGYLGLYHKMDISLDPLPYTGHSTTLDSLWMGVPVVTLSGDTVVSRGSVTGLTHTGLTQLIATDEQQYVEIAGRLARDHAALSHLRASLRRNLAASPICDEVQFTRDLETLYNRIL